MSENQITAMSGILSRPSEYVLGIDLGTTNSSVAVYGSHGMDVINIPAEGLSMPSVVRFPDRRKEKLQVGCSAKHWIISKPDEVFSSFKTQMASSEWELDPLMKEKYTIEGEELNPTFMATQVLIKIREAVQQHPIYGKDGTICKAVICVPAQSQSTYVENVYRAAKDAGFGDYDTETGEKLYDEKGRVKGVTILEEPTAAAIAYGLMDNFFGGERNRKQKILIYDFGGGTFDVTLLEVTSAVGKTMPTFEVINKGGDAKLGGDDVDWRLVDLLATKLTKITGFDVLSGEDSLKIKAVLKSWAEEAKKEFSSGAAEYEFEKNMTIGEKSYDFSERVSKNDFLSVVQPIIDRTIDIMMSVVKESHTDIDDINRIVLVGGSSKGYWVYNAVKDKLGREPYFASNLDTFVSAGASYYGANLPVIEPLIDIDVLPMNYGIELSGGTYGPILLKGEKFDEGKVSRTCHYTNANDSGILSLVGWTFPAQIEVSEENSNYVCERSVNETDQCGNKLFTWIGEFTIEIPKKPAGTLDIELTMTVYQDKTLLLTGTVDGKQINSDNIKWIF